jgi:omega-6 fatty acid desaturase (delta-12 desaturase)
MLVTSACRFRQIRESRSCSPLQWRDTKMKSRTSHRNVAQNTRGAASIAAGRLAARCAVYRGADPKRAIVQLIVTGGLFLSLCAAMMLSVERAFWLTVVLTLPTAGLLVRLFIIQHDCGHGSFLKSRAANDWLGRLVSLVTLTPYGCWRRAHARHHAASGNLDRRGTGDVKTLTVKEYRASSRRARAAYRFYRNPLVLLLVGAPLHFMVLQRLPPRMSLASREAWGSILSLNTAIVVLYGFLVAAVGVEALLMAYLPTIVIASWIGGWMFYVQHQFEHANWTRDEDWEFHAAAIHGSSYLVLPRILQWFTGSIGLHHVHHLNSMIPNYRLQECLDDTPELRSMSRLTIVQSLKCARLGLWDEERQRLVGFPAIQKNATARALASARPAT